MKAPASAPYENPAEGERKGINPDLWHACAGPLVSLPPAGSLVVYFPQGHIEQVAASMHKVSESQVPNYPNLPSKLICMLHNVTYIGKRLFAGDSVLFLRNDKSQLLLGIRRANRQASNISSSVLSSGCIHIGVLAAAAHAAANNSPFTVFYNPRASPSEFVIPLGQYKKAVYGNQISLGMRFRMMFETEESETRRYMGTITGITDIDYVRWRNSYWRNLQV
ncbi:unnamed protein product [Victoria cruziana]